MRSPRREEALKQLGADKSTKIVLVCATGSASRMIGEILVQDGYEHVYNLASGKMGWLKAGFELVKGSK